MKKIKDSLASLACDLDKQIPDISIKDNFETQFKMQSTNFRRRSTFQLWIWIEAHV